MKSTIASQIFWAGIVTATAWLPQIAQAQLPLIVDDTSTGDRDPQIERDRDPSDSTAGLQVSCQALKTVVQKGDRTAVMINWSYAGFGREYTPAKRCQIVSARLQQAANRNAGTFKDLQLASGKLNSQTIVCALQSQERRCTSSNMLFTLKPENAHNPATVVQKIFTFAQDGSSALNESASDTNRVDLDLGTWERQAFARSTAKIAPTKSRTANTGF